MGDDHPLARVEELEEELDELRAELMLAEKAVGEGWFAGDATLAEAIKRKCDALEQLAHQRSEPTLPGCLTIALLAALGVLLVAGAALAQPCPSAPDELVLARLTVHEAGWEAEADARAIYRAIESVAARAGTSWARAACLHSGRALRGETSRPWVAELALDGREPAHWPRTRTVCRDGSCRVVEHAPWSAFRDRWLATLELAAFVIGHAAGTYVDCAPETWGSHEDVMGRDGRTPGVVWIDVDCGETHNRFGRWLRVVGGGR